MKILVLNGPNLNLLGERSPDVYGSDTLASIEDQIVSAYSGVDFAFFQSNDEGALVDRLHQAHRDGLDGVVFNPGAYTHTSVALRDAIEAIAPPVIEVHLSNVYAREAFRHHSMLAPVCVGQVAGLGGLGYSLAVEYLVRSSGT